MVKGFITILSVIIVSLGLAFFAGCESDAQTGAAIGSLAGAGVGQLAGGSTESTLIGAAVGGGAGCYDWHRAGQEKIRCLKSETQQPYMVSNITAHL